MKILRAFGADMGSHPQLVRGAEFVLAAPDRVPAVFGRDSEVLWAEGEPLLLVGPQGVGKTTLMQQIALRHAGILSGELLGYPVKADHGRLTLYLALDRPQQIARSFRRMISDAQEQQLGQLVVWTGPLPFDLTKHPEKLVLLVHDIAEMLGSPVGAVFADSLKDMASPLSSDEVGAALSRAIGGVIAHQIEFAACHHQRKATGENEKPRTLADVYGSTWITAGAGSVLLLWGDTRRPDRRDGAPQAARRGGRPVRARPRPPARDHQPPRTARRLDGPTGGHHHRPGSSRGPVRDPQPPTDREGPQAPRAIREGRPRDQDRTRARRRDRLPPRRQTSYRREAA